jgi:hypothetical protein
MAWWYFSGVILRNTPEEVVASEELVESPINSSCQMHYIMLMPGRFCPAVPCLIYSWPHDFSVRLLSGGLSHS